MPSWHRGREFREGAQPECANLQTLQVSEHMLAWLLGKYGRALCQTACDPSSPATLPHNPLGSPRPVIHQMSWATSTIEIKNKQGITEDFHTPFSLMVSAGFEAKTTGKKINHTKSPKMQALFR